MDYIKLYNLKPGDRIISPKSVLGIVKHHAIYLGQNFDGQHLIAENTFGKYVRIVLAEEFFTEYDEVTQIDPFIGNGQQRRLAIERALNQMGKPYDLINFNCEHFANFVQSGQIKSDQIGIALLLSLLLVALIILND
jgi:hypothetical protein